MGHHLTLELHCQLADGQHISGAQPNLSGSTYLSGILYGPIYKTWHFQKTFENAQTLPAVRTDGSWPAWGAKRLLASSLVNRGLFVYCGSGWMRLLLGEDGAKVRRRRWGMGEGTSLLPQGPATTSRQTATWRALTCTILCQNSKEDKLEEDSRGEWG